MTVLSCMLEYYRLFYSVQYRKTGKNPLEYRNPLSRKERSMLVQYEMKLHPL